MGNTILINPYRFPPPFTAPDINFAGDDVGLTLVTTSADPVPLTMPVNTFDEGDQILVIVDYSWGSDHTKDSAPRCSDDVDGTIGWRWFFDSSDGTSDHFMDMHTKTATGGESAISYQVTGSTSIVAYVIRLGPDDHIELSSVSTPKLASIATTIADVEGVTATVDASLGWFLAMNNNSDGATLSNPGSYAVKAQSGGSGGSLPVALTIWEQNLNEGDTTNTTDVSFTISEGMRAHQIAMSRKATWTTPVIEGHQFSTGSVSNVSAFSPSNPAGMQVGDLLIYMFIISNDNGTEPIWNGFAYNDPDGYWNLIGNMGNNAGQDWRVTMGWRIWTGTEPTWSILTSDFARTCEVIMFRVTGHNAYAPIQQPFAVSTGNSGIVQQNIPVMNCAPNALAFISICTWGTPTITTPPAGLDVYATPTGKAQIYTGPNLAQDPDPYGTVIWDAFNPAIGTIGFHIAGPATFPAPIDWPLIENYEWVEQEVIDWDNGQTWNNFWGWGWKPDGTKFVTVNNSNDRIYGFDFGTPFDFTTTSNNSANPGQTVSVVGLDVMFNEDGTKYSTWSWYTNQTLRTYNAATPYEPATTDTLIGSVNLSSYSNNTMESHWIDRSGKHLFIMTSGNTPDKILHFIMTTPWDPSTIVQQSDEFDITGYPTNNRLYMSPSGRDLLFSNSSSATPLWHFRMAYPYNLNSMGEISQLDITSFGPRGGGIWMPDDASKLILGPGANDSYDIQVRVIPVIEPDPLFNNVVAKLDFTQSVNGTMSTYNEVVDLSNSAHAITYGAAATATNASGGGYLGRYQFCDGNSTRWVDLAASTDFDFGTGDFCIEFAYNHAGFNVVSGLMAAGNASNGWFIHQRRSTESYGLNFYVDGAILIGRNMNGVITLNRWSHVAITREGTNLRMFVNGVQQGATETDSTNITSNSLNFTVGQGSSVHNVSSYSDMDQVRITKGAARYTTNFTPQPY